MEVRKLRLQTGLSQSKFAKMFDVPVSTLKDWEQERRKTPAYVINMMRTILQYRGMLISPSYVEACDARRKRVENNVGRDGIQNRFISYQILRRIAIAMRLYI